MSIRLIYSVIKQPAFFFFFIRRSLFRTVEFGIYLNTVFGQMSVRNSGPTRKAKFNPPKVMLIGVAGVGA